MNEEKKFAKRSFLIPAYFILFLWLIKGAENIFDISFVQYSVYPGSWSHLAGIIVFPLIHSNIDHLLSNSLPLLLFGAGLIYFYPKSTIGVFASVYFVPGILIWLFARPSFHIGASAVIYGLAAFIFFSGVIRRDKRAIVLALLVTFVYGGMVWGVLPGRPSVSWEGHLFGALTGIVLAFIYRKRDPHKKYDWEEEDDDDDHEHGSKLEVSYTKGYPFE